MAITTNDLLVDVKRWDAVVDIAETRYRIVDAIPSLTMGLEQQRSTCQFNVLEFPDVRAGDRAVVTLNLNGDLQVVFTGFVDTRPMTDYPRSRTVYLVDELYKLDQETTRTLHWSAIPYTHALTSLLLPAGIAFEDITFQGAPPEALRTLGDRYPIVIEKGENIQSLVNEVLDYTGLALFTRPDGHVVITSAPLVPQADAVVATYAYGATKSAGEFGFLSSSRTIGGFQGPLKTYTATGPRRPDRQIPDATFTVTDVFQGRDANQEYRLCQTEAAAREIAIREAQRDANSSAIVQVQAPLNPNLRPGDAIVFRNPELGFAANSLALVKDISTNHIDMTLVIQVGAHEVAGTVSSIPPPIASFEIDAEVQPISLAGIMAVRVIVQARNTSSDPSGQGITSVQWTATCATEVDPETYRGDDLSDPDTGDPADPIFVFDTLEGALITLEVESASGEGAITTVPINPGPSERFTRSLAVASDTGWRVLADESGWRVWREADECTAVPAINDRGPQFGGFDDGSLYRTFDGLQTEPELMWTFDSAVRCLFINEADPLHMLAGISRNLFRSTDGGLTWQDTATFADAINYCENSPANPLEIRVCAGAVLYIAFDGVTFTEALIGPEDSTCRKVASAPWGHLVVWSGTATLAEAWQFEEPGLALDWQGILPDTQPTDLASVSPMQYREGYILATGAATALVRDGLYGQLSYLANGGAVTTLYTATRTGGAFTVAEVGTTQFGGPHKTVDSGGIYPVDLVDYAFGIGYGDAIAPRRDAHVLVPTVNTTTGISTLYEYDPTIGWVTRPLPPPEFERRSGRVVYDIWHALLVCPNDENKLLLVGRQRAYYSADKGVSWNAIFFPDFTYGNPDPGGGDVRAGVSDMVWTGNGDEWLMAGKYTKSTLRGVFYQSYVARGRGLDNLAQRTTGEHIVNPPPSDPQRTNIRNLGRGIAGETFGFGGVWSGEERVFLYGANTRPLWIDNDTLVVTMLAESRFQPQMTFGPNTRRTLGMAIQEQELGEIANYRDGLGQASVVNTSSGNAVVVDGKIFLGARADGIGAVVGYGVSANPAVVTVASTGFAINDLVVGHRGIYAGAVRANNVAVYVYNRLNWNDILMPDALAYNTSARCTGRIGVIDPPR